MAKKNKRELHHLRQESSRSRSYKLGNTSPNEIYKPGFPMNVLGNVRIVAFIGIFVIVSFIVVAIASSRANNSNAAADLPTPTPTSSATVDPSASPVASATANPKQFTAAEQVVDATKQYTATMKTSKGDIVIKLYADKATNTVNSFVFLAQKGFFDGITFHRVVKGFVIQGGDPTGNGSGGPGYSTAQEPNEIRNTRGTITMAKVGNAKEFGSQFFINLKDNSSLDYNQSNPFFPFGEVTSGMDVVDAIANSPTSGEKPNPPITINSVTIEVK